MRPSSRTKAQVCLLTLCGAAGLAFCTSARAVEEPPHPAALDEAIIAAAKRHGVPERLVRRIIMRESKYNPKARNRSFWGLMQISYPTAKSMGFKGTREELLNPVVNLRYAVPYLANAFVIAGKRDDAAVRLYAAGYYFTAKSKGLLNVLRTADSTPLSGVPDEPPVLAANAVAQPPQSVGIFGALFGPGQQPAPQPQVLAYAADASPAPKPSADAPAAASQATAPAGTFDGASVAMVTNTKGEPAPPKKWTRDGGMTLVARGEQGLDHLADRSHANDDVPRKTARRHPQKITLVAALDVPPSSAQAYAGAPAQDPRFAATDSQAAITQATTAPAPTGQLAAGPQVSAVPQAPAADDKPTKRLRAAKHHKPKSDETQQALADKPADTPAQPAAPQ